MNAKPGASGLGPSAGMDAGEIRKQLRDPQKVDALRQKIHSLCVQPMTFMEVCGTHTQAVFQYGLRQILPPELTLLSGPGCPVCVTSDAYIERARQLAGMPDVTICTFGDLMRVPSSNGTLEKARTECGADVRITYSPWDALLIAKNEPARKVVFLGVGFETTAPLSAATIQAAHKQNIQNFYLFSAHKTMPQPMRALAAGGDIVLDGFICPGHVSTITGCEPYRFLAEEYGKPCVVAGFEPTDIMQALAMLAAQVREGRAEVENQYERLVRTEGNRKAVAVMQDVFEARNDDWRGLGTVPGSGLGIREQYAAHDLERWDLPPLPELPPERGCVCGDVLRGAKRPEQCALFGKACTPDRPRGPCMVSHEGTCNAHYRYNR